MRQALLKNICNSIFTGIPPRAKVEAGVPGQSVRVVGIRALTLDGMLDESALERMNVSEHITAEPVAKSDVLLSIRGTTPKCALVEEGFDFKLYPSGNLAVIRPNPAFIDPHYLWSLLLAISKREKHPLLNRATTLQLSIRIRDLANLPVAVPPMGRQIEVGQIAWAFSRAVQAERSALEQGKRTFQAFLEEAFVGL